jgi:hypothetical protein
MPIDPNILLSGNEFNALDHSQNRIWQIHSANSFVDNSDTAPDGSLTASVFTHASGNNGHIRQTLSTLVPGTYTISFYLKEQTANINCHFEVNGTSSGFFSCNSSWQRFTYTFTADSSFATTPTFDLVVDVTQGVASIWGAQLVLGSVPLDYIVEGVVSQPSLNGNRLGYRIGTSNRTIGSASTAPEGFGVLNLTNGKVFISHSI